MIVRLVARSAHQTPAQVDTIAAAINQIAPSFTRAWGVPVQVLTQQQSVHSRHRPRSGKEDTHTTSTGRVIHYYDMILYLVDNSAGVSDAYGYHSVMHNGVPEAYVDVALCLDPEIGVPVSSVVGHEVWEAAADPNLRRLVIGPHPFPGNSERSAIYPVEVCDAVQGDLGDVGLPDGTVVKMPNFLYPAAFGLPNPTGLSGFDLLGKTTGPFEVRPGGYVEFYDPLTHRQGHLFGGDMAKKLRAERSESGLGLQRSHVRRGLLETPTVEDIHERLFHLGVHAHPNLIERATALCKQGSTAVGLWVSPGPESRVSALPEATRTHRAQNVEGPLSSAVEVAWMADRRKGLGIALAESPRARVQEQAVSFSSTTVRQWVVNSLMDLMHKFNLPWLPDATEEAIKRGIVTVVVDVVWSALHLP